MKNFTLAAALLLTVSLLCLGQTQAPLKNRDVIDLSTAGLSVEIIVAKIKASPVEFDTSIPALQELKKAGVPDGILVAMVEAAAKSRAAPIPTAVPNTSDRSDSASPNKWHGFTLDQSTPEDVINTLGKPIKDKLSSLPANPVSSHLTKWHKEKIFRSLEYKHPSKGVDKAWLFFSRGKLVSVMLDMNEEVVSPNGLSGIYGLEFQPVIGQVELGFNPRDYERNQGKIYPKTYPTVYHLVAAAEESFVAAMVGNVPSFGGAFARSMGVPDKPGSFPGKVMFIQLISRTLENKDGAGALK